jgi:hypothetical protein
LVRKRALGAIGGHTRVAQSAVYLLARAEGESNEEITMGFVVTVSEIAAGDDRKIYWAETI